MDFPPPSITILTNIGNELLTNESFYQSVLTCASQLGLSYLWHRKTVVLPKETSELKGLYQVQWSPINENLEQEDKSEHDGEEPKPICYKFRKRPHCKRQHPDLVKVSPNKRIKIVIPNSLTAKNHVAKSKDELKLLQIQPENYGSFKVLRNYKGRRNPPSNRLYLKNLDKKCEKTDLVDLFLSFVQNLGDLRIQTFDPKGKMRGQAFVTFPTISSAKEALEHCNMILLNEKPLVIDFAKPEPNHAKL